MTRSLPLNIALIHPDAKVPAYKSAGAACFDIHVVLPDGKPVTLKPGDIHKFSTGLVFDIPEGWRIDVYGRSGMWFEAHLRLGNGVGKIDSDYRGELFISIENRSKKRFVVNNKDRLCQGELNEITQGVFTVVPFEDISETARGSNGLGSTKISD